MICTNCGKDCSDEMLFCPDCGSPLSKKCINCGKNILIDTRFCPNCGADNTPEGVEKYNKNVINNKKTKQRKARKIIISMLLILSGLIAILFISGVIKFCSQRNELKNQIVFHGFLFTNSDESEKELTGLARQLTINESGPNPDKYNSFVYLTKLFTDYSNGTSSYQLSKYDGNIRNVLDWTGRITVDIFAVKTDRILYFLILNDKYIIDTNNNPEALSIFLSNLRGNEYNSSKNNIEFANMIRDGKFDLYYFSEESTTSIHSSFLGYLYVYSERYKLDFNLRLKDRISEISSFMDYAFAIYKTDSGVSLYNNRLFNAKEMAY